MLLWVFYFAVFFRSQTGENKGWKISQMILNRPDPPSCDIITWLHILLACTVNIRYKGITICLTSFRHAIIIVLILEQLHINDGRVHFLGNNLRLWVWKKLDGTEKSLVISLNNSCNYISYIKNYSETGKWNIKYESCYLWLSECWNMYLLITRWFSYIITIRT